MIISASRRTDIPNYYSDWFFNRIKEGYLYVRNPVNQRQVSKINLSPKVVDCIVFWTKNPEPMLSRLNELEDYSYYFQFTLTGYGRDFEAGLPDKKKVIIPTFRKLSSNIGKEKVIWRYDPIAFNDRYTEQYHLRAFSQIAQALEGYTEKCVISFVDTYAKNRSNMEKLNTSVPEGEKLFSFAGKLSQIAREHGMVMATCAESADLEQFGIGHNRCIDGELIERISGCKLRIEKDRTQRPECGCVSSIDIGSYNTCLNGCKYCYANYSVESVKANNARYDADMPLLCDRILPQDQVTERKMKSLKELQIGLFDALKDIDIRRNRDED